MPESCVTPGLIYDHMHLLLRPIHCCCVPEGARRYRESHYYFLCALYTLQLPQGVKQFLEFIYLPTPHL
jgi:hypothetical protein